MWNQETTIIFPTWYRHFPRKWWVKPPTCMTVVNSSVILTNEGGCMGIKRDKSGKSNSQIVPRIWNSRPSCMICKKANLWRIRTKNIIKSDEKWTLNIRIYENTPSYPPFFSICPLQKNFIIHKYWHTHKHK